MNVQVAEQLILELRQHADKLEREIAPSAPRPKRPTKSPSAKTPSAKTPSANPPGHNGHAPVQPSPEALALIAAVRKEPPLKLVVDVPVLEKLDLRAKIRNELTARPLNVATLAKQVKEPAAHVAKCMKVLFDEGCIVNQWGEGWDESMWRWSMRTKNAANVARREKIKQLLMQTPMTHSDIRKVMKATDKQIQEDLIELRRHEMMWKMNVEGHDLIYHLPADRRAPPPQFDARLKPKVYVKPTK